MIINAALFLLQFFFGRSLGGVFSLLALTPSDVVRSLYVWQLATFLFLHGGIWNFLWNMLALWMFGKELEEIWGTQRFMRFYFLCGSGAGVCVVLAEYLAGNPNAATIGSSGSIYGILAASAALWPEREVLFIFFPMKMKYFVMLIGGIDFLISYNAGIGQIVSSHRTVVRSPLREVARRARLRSPGLLPIQLPGLEAQAGQAQIPGLSAKARLRPRYKLGVGQVSDLPFSPRRRRDSSEFPRRRIW